MKPIAPTMVLFLGLVTASAVEAQSAKDVAAGQIQRAHAAWLVSRAAPEARTGLADLSADRGGTKASATISDCTCPAAKAT